MYNNFPNLNKCKIKSKVTSRLGHSSPEITLKYYSHLWSRSDGAIANVITGDIEINLAKTSQINFYGSQHVVK